MDHSEKLTPQEKRYLEEMGRESLWRQQELAKLHCKKCGVNTRDDPHHPLCPKRER